jgi:hypothetical protein
MADQLNHLYNEFNINPLEQNNFLNLNNRLQNNKV